MTSNLLIGYHDIALKATLTASQAATTGHLETALCLGGRRTYWKSATSYSLHALTFDLGSGITSAVDYVFIARANLLTKADATTCIELESSSNGTTWTGRASSSPIASADMAGFRLDDYLKTFAQTSAYRYWRLVFTNSGSTSIQPACSKVMFGEAFDFGRDPVWHRKVSRDIDRNGQRDAIARFELVWNGITEAKKTEFMTEIGEYQDVQSVCLIAETYSDILMDARAVHVRITELEIEPINIGNYRISIAFEELI